MEVLAQQLTVSLMAVVVVVQTVVAAVLNQNLPITAPMRLGLGLVGPVVAVLVN
jgi:hypothetical protein